MSNLKNQNILPMFDSWVFCFNTKNYEKMPNCVRNTFAEMMFERNVIDFDRTNRLHNQYDDWLHEQAETELYKRNQCGLEMETYLFAKYLVFTDKTERELHKKIRNEIFNIRAYDNYPHPHPQEDDDDFECDNEFELESYY
jgi:hypothetical protein